MNLFNQKQDMSLQQVYTIIQCLDGKVVLSEYDVEKFLIVPFFKEVAQLEIGDTLDLNIKRSDFMVIYIVIVWNEFQEVSTKRLIRILNFAKLYQVKELTDHYQRIIQNDFTSSCECNDIMKAHQLYSSGCVDINEDIGWLVRWCCDRGWLTMIKWLFSLGIVNIDILRIHAFRRSIQSGHLDMAKWLFSLDRVNVRLLEEVFGRSCENGYLEIAQCLFSLGCIDIHVMDEYAFLNSCERGQLEIAKWLHYVGCHTNAGPIDIYAQYNRLYINVFRNILRNGHLDVLQWLISLADKFMIVNDEKYTNSPISIKQWLIDHNAYLEY